MHVQSKGNNMAALTTLVHVCVADFQQTEEGRREEGGGRRRGEEDGGAPRLPPPPAGGGVHVRGVHAHVPAAAGTAVSAHVLL